jgi:hypothetical protein
VPQNSCHANAGQEFCKGEASAHLPLQLPAQLVNAARTHEKNLLVRCREGHQKAIADERNISKSALPVNLINAGSAIIKGR